MGLLMENIDCIFCRKHNDTAVIEENGYKAVQCSQCGLIYVSPRPSLNDIHNLYAHDSAHQSACDHISADFLSRLYAKHNLKILKSFLKNGAILEIGAGAGYFSHEAQKTGFEPYAIEFNPIQSNYIRRELKIPCEEKPLGPSTFGDRIFDAVYHCNVISHFFDPVSEFNKINQKLKEGGYLVFETGNLGDVDYKYFKYFHHFSLPDHLFFFSTRNLRDLLQKTGFELIRIYRYSIMPDLALNSPVLKKIREIIKFKIFRHNKNKTPGNNTDIGKDIKKRRWDYFRDIFAYLLRYKAGYLLAKNNVPQTILIVARKTK